jgi:hypothetical protein
MTACRSASTRDRGGVELGRAAVALGVVGEAVAFGRHAHEVGVQLAVAVLVREHAHGIAPGRQAREHEPRRAGAHRHHLRGQRGAREAGGAVEQRGVQRGVGGGAVGHGQAQVGGQRAQRREEGGGAHRAHGRAGGESGKTHGKASLQ